MTNNNIIFIPICSYSNVDVRKGQICKDNRIKAGIYLWTNIISGKSYVGSSINLSSRFRDYFNTNYLKRQIEIKNSKIYRALIKYSYSSFRLDILEYCDRTILFEREQDYLDKLKPKYNILKLAGSSFGFKHSKKTIERMRIVHLERKHSEAHPVKVINNKTDEIKLFPSIRQAAKFIGINGPSVSISIKNNKFYTGRGYFIIRI